jgi:multidrug transporter EmrE-like cation transporter
MDMTTVPRLLGVSPAVHVIVVSVITMLVLALLDFIGAVFAKEWADGKHPVWFAAGLLTFGVLFTFYAFSLKTAELSIVTIGWVVFLQVGLVLYEKFRFGVTLSPVKWAAIALILGLQAYLVLVPNEKPESSEASMSAPTESVPAKTLQELTPIAPV